MVLIPWYTRENYQRHRALNSDLQRTFDAWRRSAQRATKMLADNGLPVQRVPIEPEGLIAWCMARRRKVDAYSRAIYVAEVATAEDTGNS